MSEKIGQLKLKAQEGKYQLTDVVDIEGMFRIIESIPSKIRKPIKVWLSKLGSERIEEDIYRAKGYDEKWIKKFKIEKS